MPQRRAKAREPIDSVLLKEILAVLDPVVKNRILGVVEIFAQSPNKGRRGERRFRIEYHRIDEDKVRNAQLRICVYDG